MMRTATVDGLTEPLKCVAIHHFGKILPSKNDENMIIIDLSISPLLGYSTDLFAAHHKHQGVLQCMMDEDLYCILYPNDDSSVIVKQPQIMDSEKLNQLLFYATLGINDFNLQNVLHCLIKNDWANPVEVFCNIDTEADQYFSESWVLHRKSFEFKKLEGDHTICMEKK